MSVQMWFESPDSFSLDNLINKAKKRDTFNICFLIKSLKTETQFYAITHREQHFICLHINMQAQWILKVPQWAFSIRVLPGLSQLVREVIEWFCELYKETVPVLLMPENVSAWVNHNHLNIYSKKYPQNLQILLCWFL